MNQNKKRLQTNKVENSKNKNINDKQKNENILKRVSIYQIKTKHPMFSYADSNTFYGKNLYNLANYYIRQCFINHSKDEKDLTQEQKGFIENINKYIKKYNEQYANNFRKNNKKNLIKYMKKYNLLKTQENKGNEILELDEKINKLFKKRMNLQVEISKENGLLSYNFLNYYFAHCLNTEDNPYKTLPIPTAQQVLRYLEKNWVSTFKSMKKYAKDSSNYTGRPKLPKYKKKDGRIKISFTYQQCKIKDGYLTFPKTDLTIKLGFDYFGLILKEVRIVPMGSIYKVEVIWNKQKQEPLKDLNVSSCIAIDLGVSNIATITNNIGDNPIIINGRKLKHINHCYNKEKAKLQEKLPFVENWKGDLEQLHWSKLLSRITKNRNNKMDSGMHKISKYIIDYCLKNKIGKIVIGLNNTWKQNINIGTKNNQNFVTIPFRTLINQIIYKAEEVGILVIVREESYTSQASFLDLDEIPTYKTRDSTTYHFSGKRIKRGLYKSKDGTYINADVNGSYNIMRKEFPKLFTKDTIKTFKIKPKKVNIL